MNRRLAMNHLITQPLLLGGTALAQPTPSVAAGRIERIENLASRHVNPRHVDVWLPARYDPNRRYAVLYMHDGQMLFDARTTWNQQSWEVAPTMDRLQREGRIADTLVVGIWNDGERRRSEYFPQKALVHVPEAARADYTRRHLAGQPRADAYLRFVVEELKPLIDARYATRPGRESTFVMGSSMGGLISLYALAEYPQVFGGAAALSTHWPGDTGHNAAVALGVFTYLRDRLVPKPGQRLYMDHGTTELDAIYAPYQGFVDVLMRQNGWTVANLSSRVFEGTGHNEREWAARLEVPLAFLLGGPR
jgi:enterochelin esterase-like enzyme